MWPGLETDELGSFAVIRINRALYSDVAIFKTAYWFTDRFYLFLDTSEDGRIVLELRAKNLSQPPDLQVGCAEFCNSLIDFRVRDIVLGETGSVRDALVAKAFMEGVPNPGLPGVQSDERHLK